MASRLGSLCPEGLCSCRTRCWWLPRLLRHVWATPGVPLSPGTLQLPCALPLLGTDPQAPSPRWPGQAGQEHQKGRREKGEDSEPEPGRRLGLEGQVRGRSGWGSGPLHAGCPGAAPSHGGLPLPAGEGAGRTASLARADTARQRGLALGQPHPTGISRLLPLIPRPPSLRGGQTLWTDRQQRGGQSLSS